MRALVPAASIFMGFWHVGDKGCRSLSSNSFRPLHSMVASSGAAGLVHVSFCFLELDSFSGYGMYQAP